MKAGKNKRPFHKTSAKAPLRSWDIFMEGYGKRAALMNDKVTLEQLALKHHWQNSFDFEHLLFNEGKIIVVTSPALQISFASSNITTMNGYAAEELLGKSPKIFQGRDTSAEATEAIRQAIDSRTNFQVSIINYKKNGLPYQCNIDGYPVYNKRKELVHFIAFETSVEISTGRMV